ncbi:E3 ubiquitin-protein ligase rpm-1 [Frankliniella fusca]|uniref:E3 ubiquitin-protein ligase rpm-1 n=1 Tax=Frankliniella fusca TaxID=407009 RepID=A0AAE1LH46_9NEOP|nr:E3 ubiquitin-protein ligase rpm-1 [Frankliniella fusca]
MNPFPRQQNVYLFQLAILVIDKYYRGEYISDMCAMCLHPCLLVTRIVFEVSKMYCMAALTFRLQDKNNSATHRPISGFIVDVQDASRYDYALVQQEKKDMCFKHVFTLFRFLVDSVESSGMRGFVGLHPSKSEKVKRKSSLVP